MGEKFLVSKDRAKEVLEFWFGKEDSTSFGKLKMKKWFFKDEEFD